VASASLMTLLVIPAKTTILIVCVSAAIVALGHCAIRTRQVLIVEMAIEDQSQHSHPVLWSLDNPGSSDEMR
jgi:hypothetical protein